MTALQHLVRPDGVRLAYRVAGDPAAPPVVLLHATLSTSAQLAGLARELAGSCRVLVPDRRGSGGSRLPAPAAVGSRLPAPAAAGVPAQVADLLALLDAEGIGRADLVGHSFGGVVALEAAARHPGRVRAVVAWEPPYLALATPRVRRGMQIVARAVRGAFAAGGPPAAARAFIDGITAPGTFDGMPERTRAFLASEGAGALADVGLDGLDPAALSGIRAPATLLGGTRSEPFYGPILEALAATIPGARRVTLDGLRHTSPITDPALVAPAILAALEAAAAAAARAAQVVTDPAAAEPAPPAAIAGLAAGAGAEGPAPDPGPARDPAPAPGHAARPTDLPRRDLPPAPDPSRPEVSTP